MLVVFVHEHSFSVGWSATESGKYVGYCLCFPGFRCTPSGLQFFSPSSQSLKGEGVNGRTLTKKIITD
jgi:hypothetical protein